MVCFVKVVERQVFVKDWSVYIAQNVINRPRAGFKMREIKEFSTRSSRKITLSMARSEAYRDAYAMIFMATQGEAIPLVGDKTVLHNLIESEFLSFNESAFTLEMGCKALATLSFGMPHIDGDGDSYQAILSLKNN